MVGGEYSIYIFLIKKIIVFIKNANKATFRFKKMFWFVTLFNFFVLKCMIFSISMCETTEFADPF